MRCSASFTRMACPLTSTDDLGPALWPPHQHREPHAERSRFADEYVAQRRHRRGIAQGAHRVSGAALLHHDGGDPRVVGAGREQLRHAVGEDLAGDVVDVGFEQGHRGAVGASIRTGLRRGRAVGGRGVGDRAHHGLHHVRPVRRVGGARAVADCGGDHRRHLPERRWRAWSSAQRRWEWTPPSWCRDPRSARGRRRAGRWWRGQGWG
jgi:hypothetical protein